MVEHRFTAPIIPNPDLSPPEASLYGGQRKLNNMYERTERDERCETHDGQPGGHHTGVHAWCAVDPGDTHDKGEESLCVGEAA